MPIDVLLQRLPCRCGVGWEAHRSVTDHRFWMAFDLFETLTPSEQNAFLYMDQRRTSGRLDPELPSPPERKRIRTDAGLTQRDVAELLYVSRHTVAKWEKQSGWLRGQRLAGREPSGDLRKQYAAVLANMRSMADRR